MGSRPNTHIDITNVRLPEQEKVMKQIERDGVCPFCPENLHRYHTEPILKEGAFWIITKNRWPYAGTVQHFLAISKAHVTNLTKLDPEAGKELVALFQEIAKEYNVRGGGMAMRFGGEGYASSVKHLHAHLIQPDIENPDHEGVKFPLSKTRG